MSKLKVVGVKSGSAFCSSPSPSNISVATKLNFIFALSTAYPATSPGSTFTSTTNVSGSYQYMLVPYT